jgi:hypothetical protein
VATFEGIYTGTTRPAQGVHPFILAVATPDGIGALPVVNPTSYCTLSCKNLTASGTVDLPAGSLAIADVANLQSSLNNKATVGGSPSFGILMATHSFTSTFGTAALAAGTSATIYTIGANQRGFVFVDTNTTNATSPTCRVRCT